jgi:ATP-dependent helicase/nuclease subunit B
MKNDASNMLDCLKNRRFFLGLDRPPLVSATQWFFDNYVPVGSSPRVWSLEDLIVVLPTSRSKVRLHQLLSAKAATEGVELHPPVLTTVGDVPELLYTAQKALASDLVQQIAWTKALTTLDPDQYQKLTDRDDGNRPETLQPLASMMGALHERLSTDIWSFRSIAREVGNQNGFLKEESKRWEVLENVQQSYYRILSEVNLWDRQAARNYVAAGLMKAGEIRCRTSKTLVMLAVADLPRSIAEMLRQVAVSNPDQIRILIAGTPAMDDRFDELGSLITEHWLEVPIPISDEKIRIVDRPADQALATAHFLCQFPGAATDETTIGVPDETVLPQVERALNSLQLPHRYLAGRKMNETPPVKLLIALGEYLRDFRFDAFTSLVRHPDLFHWLSTRIKTHDWLTDLDQFQNEKLPHHIELNRRRPFGNPAQIAKDFQSGDIKSEARAARLASAMGVLNDLHQALAGLLKPLLSKPKPIRQWAAAWQKILNSIYVDSPLKRSAFASRQVRLAWDAIAAAFSDQLAVPGGLQPDISAVESLEWALRATSEKRVAPPEDPQAIELAGWLELTLDDAPVLAITGMNDGIVPSDERSHPFLPNELCRQLNILDDNRRYARDCYALTVITSVRENYLLILGRHDETGNPLRPSRLIFADTAEVAAKRAKAFFGFPGRNSTDYWLGAPVNFQPHQALPIPKPDLAKPLEQITVTRFRDYIKCPYRFYLQHVLGLQCLDDTQREMDGGRFGDLVHHCMETFGRDEISNSQNATLILRFLNAQLDAEVKRRFPEGKLPAVEMQVQQIRLRFERFAQLQARRRTEGWRIVSTEELVEYDFDVDGTPFLIRGKIDRIDQHETSGQIAVWDYKSSDKGEGPVRVHYMPLKNQWKDLQLPLYRFLVEKIAVLAGSDFSSLTTGFLLLPKRLEDIRFEVTGWTETEYQAAAEMARSILRQIRQSVYWPPNPIPPEYSEDFAAICQDQVFERFPIEVGA